MQNHSRADSVVLEIVPTPLSPHLLEPPSPSVLSWDSTALSKSNQPLWFVLPVVCATAHRPTILFLYQVLTRFFIPGIAEIFYTWYCGDFLYQVLPRFFLYQVLLRFFIPGIAEIFYTRYCRDIFAPRISLRPRILSVRST